MKIQINGELFADGRFINFCIKLGSAELAFGCLVMAAVTLERIGKIRKADLIKRIGSTQEISHLEKLFESGLLDDDPLDGTYVSRSYVEIEYSPEFQ